MAGKKLWISPPRREVLADFAVSVRPMEDVPGVPEDEYWLLGAWIKVTDTTRIPGQNAHIESTLYSVYRFFTALDDAEAEQYGWNSVVFHTVPARETTSEWVNLYTSSRQAPTLTEPESPHFSTFSVSRAHQLNFHPTADVSPYYTTVDVIGGYRDRQAIGELLLKAPVVTPKKPCENLGEVTDTILEGLSLGDGSLLYCVEATNSGILTIEASGRLDSENCTLRLYEQDPNINPAASPVAQDSTRIDQTVVKGSAYHVEVLGNSSDLDLRFMNLLGHSGDTATLKGTDGPDALVFSAGQPHFVSINGLGYNLPEDVTRIEFTGGEGFDVVRFYDSPGNETVEAWPDRAVITNSSNDLTDDYTVSVSGIESLLAYATRGGTDSATLHGSEGGDKLKSYEDFLRLRAKDDSYALRAKRFDTVIADSGSAGSDLAVFNGSKGNDTFRYDGATNTALVEATDRDHAAVGFNTVVVRAGGDGHSVAHFTDTPGRDIFYFRSHKTVLVSPQAKVTVRVFDEVHATSGESQEDVARIYDTVSDERLLIEGEMASLYRWIDPELELMYETIGFYRVKAYSSEGDDKRDERAHTIDELLLTGWDEEV